MREKKKPGSGQPPSKNNNKNGKGKRPPHRRAEKDAVLMGNARLIEYVRQIIADTPEIRPEKVAPIMEALERGTYQADVRKLANILIARFFLDL